MDFHADLEQKLTERKLRKNATGPSELLRFASNQQADLHASLHERLIQRGLLQEAQNASEYCVNPPRPDAGCMECGGCTKQLQKVKTTQRIKKDPYSAALNKKALINPGGVSFDVSGGNGLTDYLNPMNRSQQPAQTAPATKARPLNLRELYPSLFEGVGKHEAPEYVGKHDQAPPGLFDRFKQWLSNTFNSGGAEVGRHNAPEGSSVRRNPGGDISEIWSGREQPQPYDMVPKKKHDDREMMLPLVAAEEIKTLVCEALMVENDFEIVSSALEASGYQPLQVIAALENNHT